MRPPLWHDPLRKNYPLGTQPRQKAPKLLIVDGQQRLTSLFAVFKGRSVLDQDFKEARLEISFRSEKHEAQYGKVSAEPTDQTGVLQYTYLGLLVQLMVMNEAWDLFKPMFRDRRELEDLVLYLRKVRTASAKSEADPVAKLGRDRRRSLEREVERYVAAGHVRENVDLVRAQAWQEQKPRAKR